MSILVHNIGLLVYEDTTSNNNPFTQTANWRKSVSNVSVSNPKTEKFSLPPNSSLSLFSGTRTTLIDNTSVFSIALNSQNSSVYRIANTSGTAPAFRTDRALTLTGATITVALNNNATATFTTSTGNFSAVQVGDIVFVPGVNTGDSASPFSATNLGFWVVLARTTTVITLSRLAGQSFSGVAEVVVLTANSQLQAFSSLGVQVGDTLEISAGFSVITQKSYIVSTVTPSWVEFVSTESLPLETSISPTNSGLTFYSVAKRYVRIEADQECTVRYNGDTGSTNRIVPRVVGDLASGFAFEDKWGVVWSLDVVNRSRTASMNIILITAE
jgi:hypothetical protein